MKKILFLTAPFLFVLAGCGQAEEPGEPLSPQAQEALKSGKTGMPPEALKASQGGANPADAGRGAAIKK